METAQYMKLSYDKSIPLSRKQRYVSMGYMEIAILPHTSLKIKGKYALLGIDPQDNSPYNGAILLGNLTGKVNQPKETVVISGPGEYEIGGVKMTGMRNEEDVLYSMNIDGVEVLLGKVKTLEKMQHKLKEHNIVVVNCDNVTDSSFLTSLASNVVLFYGEKATELSQTFGRDNVKKMSKFSTVRDKLPAEVETVVLA